MACSTQSTILIVAEATLASFESFVPVLEAAGKLNPVLGGQIQTYVNTATTTLNGVIVDLETNTSTLSKIQTSVQTLVTGFNGFSGVVPPGISLTVNLVNAGLQTLLFAIEQQQSLVAPPAPVAAAPVAHALVAEAVPAHQEEMIHTSIFERHQLNGYKSRIQKLQDTVAKLTA
jgi:hypothetical protein